MLVMSPRLISSFLCRIIIFNRNYGSANDGVAQFSRETIERDVTDGREKPLWPFSAYGPAKGEPNMIDKLEESSDEFRIKFWQAKLANNIAQYTSYEESQGRLAESLYQIFRNNSQGAYESAFAASPNTPTPPNLTPAASNFRNLISAFSSLPPSNNSSDPSNEIRAQTTPNAFERASGAGSFGGAAPSQFGSSSGVSGFGVLANKPSVFGPSSSAFAKSGTISAFGTSTFGNPQPSAFGASALGGNPRPAASAFGNTSTIGNPGQSPSAFGNSQTMTSSAFGAAQPAASAFGSPQPTTATASASQPVTTSVFGNPSGGSVFGRPSAFGAAVAPVPPSAFGDSSHQPSNFGASQPQQSAPDKPPPVLQSAFGNPKPPAQSAFGKPQPSTQSAFVSSSTPTSSSAPISAFGAPKLTTTSAFGGDGGSASSASGTLVPAGAQIALGTARDKSDELIPPNYGDLLPVEMKQAFEAETFEWGKIPDWIPPPSLR